MDKPIRVRELPKWAITHQSIDSKEWKMFEKLIFQRMDWAYGKWMIESTWEFIFFNADFKEFGWEYHIIEVLD